MIFPSSSPILRFLGIELSVVSWPEKLIAGIGGVISILLLILISERFLGIPHATALVASMGASAVLLYAVPHGQLSQPWPLVGGHCISAAIGVSCAKLIPDPLLAAACSVGLSITAMHQWKCIHPPGGATALTAVLGGPGIHALGYRFVLCPVLLNTLIMTTTAIVLNLPFPWRRYPAAWIKRDTSPETSLPDHQQIVTALRQLDSFVDITEEDLLQLIRLLNPQTALSIRENTNPPQT